MIRSRLYRDGALSREDLGVDEVIVLAADPANCLWLDLDAGSVGELDRLREPLGLHSLAIEDAGEDHQRAKLDRYEDHFFLSLYQLEVPAPGAGALGRRELNAFMTPNVLVTVRKDRAFDMAPVVERWDSRESLVARGAGGLVWGLLDAIVDNHLDVVQALDEQADALEEQVFRDHPDTAAVQRGAFAMHKQLVTVRRVALPMREITTELMTAAQQRGGKRLQPYLQDVYDHALRVTDDTDAMRDLVATIIDTNLNAQSNRMNLVMKKVTSWAAIIAVPTLVTGFFGMNVALPFGGTAAGVWVAVGVCLASAGVLFTLFKRNDWL